MNSEKFWLVFVRVDWICTECSTFHQIKQNRVWWCFSNHVSGFGLTSSAFRGWYRPDVMAFVILDGVPISWDILIALTETV